MSKEQTAALLIIEQRIRDGRRDAYLAWEQKVAAAAAGYPGYLGSEVKPPNDREPRWVVIYRFDSTLNVQNWLNSATRQHLIRSTADLFDGPGTLRVITDSNEILDPCPPVVVTHPVADDQVEAFLVWREKMVEAESRYPGYLGSELFRPVEGVQDQWSTILRFDTVEHLDAWLASQERRDLLAEGARFGEFELRRTYQPFGNWFKPKNPQFKTAIAVWMGLYPTVVLLTLLMAPLNLPFWLAMLVGNLVSSLVMSYLTMKFYVTKIMGWWTSPAESAPQPATDVKGFLLILAINATWAVVFYLLTVKAGVHP